MLVGQFLQKKAIERGVKYQSCHVKQVQLAENGDIASVVIDDGTTIAGDFFVDCTGFAGLLIQQAMKTPFVSFSNNLFNDAAVAMPTPIGDDIPSQTVAFAMKHGWRWKIPLTSRFGNGYVYSSAFCSADEAERELREHLGLLDSDTPARHLKMKIGRVTKHWNRIAWRWACRRVSSSRWKRPRCCSSSRPYRTSSMFWKPATWASPRGIASTKASTSTSKARATTSSRTTRPTPAPTPITGARMPPTGNLSEPLQQLFRMWLSGKSIVPDVSRQTLGKGYPVFSWYCIMSGMGIFPDAHDLRAPTAAEARYNMAEIDDLLDRSIANFPAPPPGPPKFPPGGPPRSPEVFFLVGQSMPSALHERAGPGP